MAADLATLEQEGLRKIREAADADVLFIIEKELFSRKHGLLTLELQKLGKLPEAERRSVGASLNAVKQAFERALDERRRALEESKAKTLAEEDWLDLTMDLPAEAFAKAGHLHLIPEFLRKVEEVFGRMGFDVAYGPEIETEDYNFTLLNIPEDHPARDAMGTFFVRLPSGERRVLRTHTSPVQIRYMQSHQPPFRMICPGKAYRKDDDATHSPMFHQFEGLMIGKDVSLRHMKGVMIAAVKELLSPHLSFRFRASYFPFVEPGLEMDIKWQGDLAKSREGQWLEVAGCGMVHPQVLRNVKIDPKQWQGFAFGFGVERLLMIKHQIPDIRLFYAGDLRFLAQF